MSLIDGLEKALINPIFEDALESRVDSEMEFEMALEAAVDKQIELTDTDINAILDDDNLDNVVADLTARDEAVTKIEEDATVPNEFAAIESALDALMALESRDWDKPEDDDPDKDPSNNRSATESEDEDVDDFEDEDEDSNEDEDDEHIGLDSLLESIFND